MRDVTLAPPPPRADLLRLIAARLGDLVPRGHLLAQDLLGAVSRIDFALLEPDGGVALVLVGDPGEDLALVARGLAQRAWVERRLGDWLQLAPDLALRPEAGVRVWLVCDAIGEEARAAAESLAPEGLRLALYRCVRTAAGMGVLIERDGPPAAPPSGPPSPGGPAISRPAFRTGLRDADLDLEVTAEERERLLE